MFDVLDYLSAEEAPSTPAASQTVPLANNSEGICFEISRNVLKVLLEKAVEVVPSKDMIPVLKNFQFRVRSDKLAVVASNLSMSVISTTAMSVETKSSGVDIFPARKLLEIVRESDADSRIYISVTGRTAIVVAGSASWEINLGKGNDFPRMPKVENNSLQRVDKAEFLRCLSTVKYAVASSGRESLMVVNIANGRFTACDGSRLQQARMEELKASMNIPAPAADKLLKMLKGSDAQDLYVGEVEGKLVFRVGTDTLLVNKTDTTFPPMEGLWLRPALSNDQELVVEKTLLLDAIRRVKVNVDLEYNAISLKLVPTKTAGFMGEMIISACNADGESAETTIPVQWSGAKRELVLHYRYLREALSAYPNSECMFKLGEDQKTKKAPVLLLDAETRSMGIVQQMVGVPTDRRRGPSR